MRRGRRSGLGRRYRRGKGKRIRNYGSSRGGIRL